MDSSLFSLDCRTVSSEFNVSFDSKLTQDMMEHSMNRTPQLTTLISPKHISDHSFYSLRCETSEQTIG
jgi:hypothetical protein